ncbi:FAD-dependent oxidoreductase [Candidatus Microgenomates bacterium]|nr:FAD-dependent oxidoreductase [Candidatus Microgenomates bacterium]
MKGIVRNKKEVATGTLLVSFEVIEPFTFKPGQYCFVTLINPPYPDDRGNRRHFSIVNSPNEKGTITITTRLSESGFKRGLRELKIGDQTQLGPIAGAFVLPDDTSIPLVLIAGGIGITPFMSILKFVAEERLPYQITLIYSNRDQSSTTFYDELQLLSTQLPNFQLVLTMTEDPNWTGEKRRVDTTFIKEYFPNVNAQKYMVVGPPGMVSAVQNALLEAGVTPDNINVENFTGY